LIPYERGVCTDLGCVLGKELDHLRQFATPRGLHDAPRYACQVTELRVTVPDEIAERLASEANDQGTSVEHVAAEVLRLHVSTVRGEGLDFIALARSKHGFSARRAEEQLEAEGFA